MKKKGCQINWFFSFIILEKDEYLTKIWIVIIDSQSNWIIDDIYWNVWYNIIL